jgi:hypothetical protein
MNVGRAGENLGLWYEYTAMYIHRLTDKHVGHIFIGFATEKYISVIFLGIKEF